VHIEWKNDMAQDVDSIASDISQDHSTSCDDDHVWHHPWCAIAGALTQLTILDERYVSPLTIAGGLAQQLGLWDFHQQSSQSSSEPAEPEPEKPQRPLRRPDPRQIEFDFNR